MQDFTPETMDALRENRVGLFVHFDFEFFPMRVHSGDAPIEWKGEEWAAIGDVLRHRSTSTTSSLSSTHCSRGEMAASLPLDKRTQEVMTKQYFRGRKMEFSMCALDSDGEVLERVHYNEGAMVECTTREDVLTFRAEFEELDSTEELDARHKRTVESVRRRFKWEVAEKALSGGFALALNTGFAIIGQWLGVVVDVLGTVVPDANRRTATQRRRAQKRVYWFRTEPAIPKLRLRKDGYKIVADTLEEARTELYGKIARVLWDFPRGRINLLVSLNGRPLEMFNLDSIRKLDDPERWEATDAIRQWLKPSEEGPS